MKPSLADYHRTSSQLRSKILRSEEQRVELEQKLRSLSTVDARLHHHEQTEHVKTYFARLNEESQHAEQRNMKLLNDLTQAEHHLNQLRIDADRLIRSRHARAEISPSYNFDRSPTDHQVQHNEVDETYSFSRAKRPGSLRMELNRSGLYFLLDYLEREFVDTIDKQKFYRHDPPTLAQKRSIIDIANRQDRSAINDLDPTTTSMAILDQLPSTVRRSTTHQCLLTEEILSANIRDLDQNAIAAKLPEQDRSLWTRLMDHFMKLIKCHIMNSHVLASKFTPALLPDQAYVSQDKARNLLEHILEKHVGTQPPSSEDDETSAETKPAMKLTGTPPSTWLTKLASTGRIDDDDDDTSTASSVANSKKEPKSASSTGHTPRAKVQNEDSDLEFYS